MIDFFEPWIGSPSYGWSFSSVPYTFPNLAPNETRSATVFVDSRENIPVGVDYEVSISLRDGFRVYHSSSVHTSLFVSCPPPRPVSHIVANPIIPFYSFGLQAGPVFLSWEACGYGLWCCCPCK